MSTSNKIITSTGRLKAKEINKGFSNNHQIINSNQPIHKNNSKSKDKNNKLFDSNKNFYLESTSSKEASNGVLPKLHNEQAKDLKNDDFDECMKEEKKQTNKFDIVKLSPGIIIKSNCLLKHIFLPAKDRFLFLYTFIKRFSDKSLLILVSTYEEAKVSIYI